jgi:hypothetical protein
MVLALGAAVFLASSCGKRKPPVPPQERVSQRAVLTGYQRGNQVILAWQMPASNALPGDALNVSRIDVYRLTEKISASQQMSEEEFANRSTLIAALKISDADFGRKTLNYRDTLEFAGQPARLRYAIRFVNSAGQKAAFSNSLLIEPSAGVPANPQGLNAETTQDFIRLRWKAPEANVDGTKPASVLGYNVYRSGSEREPGKLINTTPVNSTSFEDTSFRFGENYLYFVRALSLGSDAEPIESAESNIVAVKPLDVFPPSPPASLTVAASSQAISLFFAVNAEQDIAGYRIFRSTDPALAKKDWKLVTPELLKSNTFQDSGVESGKTYFYYVVAVDQAGNISEISEVVSETLP